MTKKVSWSVLYITNVTYLYYIRVLRRSLIFIKYFVEILYLCLRWISLSKFNITDILIMIEPLRGFPQKRLKSEFSTLYLATHKKFEFWNFQNSVSKNYCRFLQEKFLSNVILSTQRGNAHIFFKKHIYSHTCINICMHKDLLIWM